LKAKLVIDGALNESGNRRLDVIQRQKNPVNWLTENLDARFVDGSDILEISLGQNAGGTSEERAKLVNAIAGSFVRETTEREERIRSDRYGMLEKISDRYTHLIENRRTELRKLAQEAGYDTLGDETLGHEAARRLYEELRSQQVKLRVEQAGVEALLARRKKSGDGATEQTRQEASRLEDQLAAIEAQQKTVKNELDRWSNALHDFSNGVELQGKQNELKVLQESADRVARELELQKIERKAPPQVLLFELAEP
jgi:hypothetical protein